MKLTEEKSWNRFYRTTTLDPYLFIQAVYRRRRRLNRWAQTLAAGTAMATPLLQRHGCCKKQLLATTSKKIS
jgi:hypothetical protein